MQIVVKAISADGKLKIQLISQIGNPKGDYAIKVTTSDGISKFQYTNNPAEAMKVYDHETQYTKGRNMKSSQWWPKG